MGAALHLAHTHQTPPVKKHGTKGKGGGPGDRYDELLRRVYQDERQTSESRDLILLMAWLIHRDPDRHDTEIGFWERAGKILGRRKFVGREKPILADLVAADRPRYEIDHSADVWQYRTCSAPMIRRDGQCGQHATAHADQVDTNGWRWPVWYCRRHADWGRKQDLAYREALKSAPAPIPNRGGLLPSYFTLKSGDEGWVNIYEWACKWTHNTYWKTPEPYGLRADDWPRPEAEEEAETWEPPVLRLVVTNGEMVGP
ncbi:hypothetical protein [Streptomyces osmaniensis]|uniref:Uncharacterized protein n=1 Tax=Streptomyces osmaniensis TaxID=593134 RepID=A0ABP6YVS7_9ACTN|nr:hypothetical protein KJK32_46635 [Streptomyces sp. JCM17656]